VRSRYAEPVFGQRGAVVRRRWTLEGRDHLHVGSVQRRSVPRLHRERETMQRQHATNVHRRDVDGRSGRGLSLRLRHDDG
jgi:hypothetical protein